MEKEDIYILAVESSCDETAASVVRNGREVPILYIHRSICIRSMAVWSLKSHPESI